MGRSRASNPLRHGRGAGRPRTPGADETILRATLALLAEDGVAGTTMTAVAARAGVARATVYLRWRSHDALLAAAARHAMGRPPMVLTGDIEADLRAGAREAAGIIGRPAFVGVFPELVRALLSGSPEIAYDAIGPNRPILAELYRRSAADQGFREDIEPTLPFDLLAGATINHLLATGHAPGPEAMDRLADVIVAGLRRAR